MVCLIVPSFGTVNFTRANPQPFGYPAPTLNWGFANTTVFANNSVILNFDVSIGDNLTTWTHGWKSEGLKENYTVTSLIESVQYCCCTNITVSKYGGIYGDLVKEGNATLSSPGKYFINLTGAPKGNYFFYYIIINCKWIFSDEFQQDITKVNPRNQNITSAEDPYSYYYPIFFSVNDNVVKTSETALPIMPIGVGTSLALIVAVTLLVIYKKRSLKLKVKGEGTVKKDN
jgi:hypothetical protein